MQAAIATADGRIDLRRVPDPQVGPGEALLDLLACGLCGTDLYKIDNATLESEQVLGHEVVGRVSHIGEGCELEVGQVIVAPHHAPCGTCTACTSGSETQCDVFRTNLLRPGGLAERFVLMERSVLHTARVVPAEMAIETAVFLEPLACVLRAIARAQALKPNFRHITVLGGGSMGLLHVLALRALEARSPGRRWSIRLVERLPARRQLARELGADHAVAADQSLTDSELVFDTIGGSHALQLAQQMMSRGSVLVLFAHGRPSEVASLPLNHLFHQEQSIVTSYSSSPKDQNLAWTLLQDQSLDPCRLVSHRLPLEQVPEAFSLMRRHEALKVLITP